MVIDKGKSTYAEQMTSFDKVVDDEAKVLSLPNP